MIFTTNLSQVKQNVLNQSHGYRDLIKPVVPFNLGGLGG